MTNAEAIQYAIDWFRAFQPKSCVDKHGQPYWMPPGMEDATARGRWEAAMRRFEIMLEDAK